MSNEPENLVLELLRGMRAEMASMRDALDTKTATKNDVAEIRSEMRSLRADVASDLMIMQAKNEAEHKNTRKHVGEQIVGLRRAVIEYHSAVIGHGMLISEQEARIRRIERHLDLPEIDIH